MLLKTWIINLKQLQQTNVSTLKGKESLHFHLDNEILSRRRCKVIYFQKVITVFISDGKRLNFISGVLLNSNSFSFNPFTGYVTDSKGGETFLGNLVSHLRIFFNAKKKVPSLIVDQYKGWNSLNEIKYLTVYLNDIF